MEIPGIGLLTTLVEKYFDGQRLTRCELAEILHIAQGFECKDSATADDVAFETIRSRRKRLYAKLEVSGALELRSSLLAFSLKMLSWGERIEPATVGDAA